MNATTVAVDLAKNVFSLHGVEANGKVALKRTVRRAELAQAVAALMPAGASVLLRHCGGVVTCDQPLLAIPFVGVCVASPDLSPGCAKGECVEPGVNGRVTP